MKASELLEKSNKTVKVAFKERDQRLPMIGKFVTLSDSKELEKKGMVRFVNQSKFDYYDDSNPQYALTRIYTASDFNYVKEI